ncbi:MAG: SsgA family sporulation/cell division regulator [Pseudonocardiales bacterium]|nr:SsgA family sporulation/cell division regulator [Pseudonocardiales bacterium]
MATSRATQVMFAALTGHESPVMTRWTYSVSDPFAVTLAVQTPRGRWVEWLLGRDLLLAGLTGIAGDGDVRLCRQQAPGHEVITLEVRSSDGRAMFTVDRELLGRFIDATTQLVEFGDEATCIDFEAEIALLTRSCAG